MSKSGRRGSWYRPAPPENGTSAILAVCHGQCGPDRKRLGREAGILNGSGGKPKGMHRATFWRLQAAHDRHVNQSLAGMAAKLGMVMGRL